MKKRLLQHKPTHHQRVSNMTETTMAPDVSQEELGTAIRATMTMLLSPADSVATFDLTANGNSPITLKIIDIENVSDVLGVANSEAALLSELKEIEVNTVFCMAETTDGKQIYCGIITERDDITAGETLEIGDFLTYLEFSSIPDYPVPIAVDGHIGAMMSS